MPQTIRSDVGLFLAGVGTAFVYAAALLCFPLLRIYAFPIQNLQKLTNASATVGLALVGCVLLLFAGYGAGAVLLARAPTFRHKGTWPRALIVIGFPLVF